MVQLLSFVEKIKIIPLQVNSLQKKKKFGTQK